MDKVSIRKVIIQRYAKALLLFAEEKNILEKVHQGIVSFLAICKKEPRIELLLRDPAMSTTQKKRIFTTCAHTWSKEVLHFILLVIQKGRENLVTQIASQFLIAYKKKKQITTVHVTAAHTLTPQTEEKLIQLTKKLFDVNNIELLVKIDKTILGGYILKLGDYCLDASIRTKLQQLLAKWQSS